MAYLKVHRPQEAGIKRDLYRRAHNFGKIFKVVAILLSMLAIACMTVLPANNFKTEIKSADGTKTYFSKSYDTSALDTTFFVVSKIVDSVTEVVEFVEEDNTSNQQPTEDVFTQVANIKTKALNGEFSDSEKMFNLGYNVSLIQDTVDKSLKSVFGENYEDTNVSETQKEAYDAVVEMCMNTMSKTFKLFYQEFEVNNISGVNYFISAVSSFLSDVVLTPDMTAEQMLSALVTEMKTKLPANNLQTYSNALLVGEYTFDDEFYNLCVQSSPVTALKTGVQTDVLDEVSEEDLQDLDKLLEIVQDAVPEMSYMFSGGYLMLVLISLFEILFLVFPLIILVVKLLVYLLFYLTGASRRIRTSNIGIMSMVVPVIALVVGLVCSFPTGAIYLGSSATTFSLFGIGAIVVGIGAKVVQVFCNRRIKKLLIEFIK